MVLSRQAWCWTWICSTKKRSIVFEIRLLDKLNKNNDDDEAHASCVTSKTMIASLQFRSVHNDDNDHMNNPTLSR